MGRVWEVDLGGLWPVPVPRSAAIDGCSIPRHSMYAIYAYIGGGLRGQYRYIWHTWSVWDCFQLGSRRANQNSRSCGIGLDFEKSLLLSGVYIGVFATHQGSWNLALIHGLEMQANLKFLMLQGAHVANSVSRTPVCKRNTAQDPSLLGCRRFKRNSMKQLGSRSLQHTHRQTARPSPALEFVASG